MLIASISAIALPASAAHAPTTAASYINRDTGAATENSNVAGNSDCDAPDQEDTQQLSNADATNRNVHNDACLFDEAGAPFSGLITFESVGVGGISACPDPDAVTGTGGVSVSNGPGVAYAHDHDADGANEHCHQTAYQTKDAAGDDEYHARLNNSSTPGDQTVVFCYDPEQDPAADVAGQPAGHGCADQSDALSDEIVIHWVDEEVAPEEAVSYINPDTDATSENASVDPDSDCESPDRNDLQALSDAGMTNNNVHNDSCLFDSAGDDFNGSVTYASTGVGTISACPDPDSVTDASGVVTSNGSAVAFTHDHDQDGRADHCHQTGSQSKGAAGDGEYHARLNNDSEMGTQNVVFCHDPQIDAASEAGAQPEGHGCSDTQIADVISIRWVNEEVSSADTSASIRKTRAGFKGTLNSSRAECEAGRIVKLKKVRPGKDRTVGRDFSSPDGRWWIRKGASGRFYVKVPARTVQGDDGGQVNCGAGRSRIIKR